MKDTCVFYRDFRNAARNFSADKRAAFYEMVLDYAMDGIKPPPDSEFIAHFELIRSRLDADIAKYNAKSENGKKGGAPKGNQNAKKQAKITKNNQEQANSSKTSHNVNVNEYDNATTVVVNAREAFCKAYGVTVDDTTTDGIDFDSLRKAYSESAKFLQTRPAAKRMSWIIKNYDKIIAGTYQDYATPNSRTTAPQGITHHTPEELLAAVNFIEITEDD
ncbi:MAG: hypothetical protein K2K13_05845 [Clostridiales bacterium]|nr:hypothetical protein [Clostridiales bacterium]